MVVYPPMEYARTHKYKPNNNKHKKIKRVLCVSVHNGVIVVFSKRET